MFLRLEVHSTSLPALSPLKPGSQDSGEIALCAWQEEIGLPEARDPRPGIAGLWNLDLPSIVQPLTWFSPLRLIL